MSIITTKKEWNLQRLCGELLGINRNTINAYVKVFKQSDLTYDELLLKSDLALRELFPQADTKDAMRYKELIKYLPQVYADRSLPDFALRNCWSAYKENYPDGYGFTQFAGHYKRLYKKKKSSMLQVHTVSETVFVDYAGKKLSLIHI